MFTRALIVLLLILNLGVAAWWWLRPQPPAPPVPEHPAGVPRLQLLGEAVRPRPSAPPAAAARDAGATQPEAAAPAATVPAEQRCYAFGPFADEPAAGAARARLQPLVARLDLRTDTPRATGAWNVLLPPLPDRAAAQAMAQRIDAAGFKDYYVIGQGESANGIALGRFGSEDSARRHQVALQAAGFPAQLQAPAGAAVRYWLDAQATATFDPVVARGRIGAAQAQPVDCGALG